MEIVSIPVIATAIYGIIEVYKMVFKSETAKRIIPIIAGVLGVILGIAAFYLCPMILPTDNVFMAAVIGLASGLSSVGINQIGKQITKKDGNNK